MANARTPSPKAVASRIKKLLVSEAEASIAAGAADLAAAAPEVADHLLEGIAVKEVEPVEGFPMVVFEANKAFTGTRREQPSLDRALREAVVAAPSGSEAEALRRSITGVSLRGPVDLRRLLEAMPTLTAIAMWNGPLTGLDAVAGSELQLLHLRGPMRSAPLPIDLGLLRGARLVHLAVSPAFAITGLDALSTLPLRTLVLSRVDRLEAALLADLPLESLVVAGRLTGLERLPGTLRRLVLTTDRPVDLAGLHAVPLDELVVHGPHDGRPAHPTARVVELTGSGLRDLSGLSGLPTLTDLRLRRCEQLANVAAVAAMPRLEVLEIEGSRALLDTSPLQGRRWHELKVRGCGAPDLPPATLPDHPLELVRWPTPWVRASAARQLAPMSSWDVTRALVELLADRDGDVVRAAATVLLDRSDAIDALLGVLADGPTPARTAAAWALYGRRRPEGLEPLIAALRGDLAPIAAVALSRIPGHEAARGALEAACSAADPELRRWAAFTLGAIGSPASEGTLARLLSDPATKVRRAALGALHRIGARDAVSRGRHDAHPGLRSLTEAWLLPPVPPAEPKPSRIPPGRPTVKLETWRLPDLSKVDTARVESLDIGAGKHSAVDDGFVLPPMPSLTDLAILSRKLTSARIAAGIPTLQRLWLSYNNRFRDLDGVQGLAALRSLHVRNTRVADLTPIAGLDLAQLVAYHTDVVDLRPVFANCELEHLDVHATGVADLRGIERLESLRALDISETLVTDLSPIAGLPRLEHLAVRKLPVDLAPLVRLPALRSLDLGFGDSPFDHPEWLLFERRTHVTLPLYFHRRDPLGDRAVRAAVEADKARP